ncbi:hypothetical protein GCM10011515_03280 [Tsuneonella deserti]|uniref:Uncharacterized protein n=1 Tax=Tsuneonella deserti TaxID=2035528 RepID=A0ABQ1RYA8_9SPHN|nr:hypothetical protein GCM10011515_03280 [Tsuneonella deserti]
MQGRGRRGAGVLNVYHWDSAETHCARHDFATDHVLTLHMPLDAIAEKQSLDIVRDAAGIGKSERGRLGAKLLQALIELLAKPSHTDANDENVIHFMFRSFIGAALDLTDQESGASVFHGKR